MRNTNTINHWLQLLLINVCIVSVLLICEVFAAQQPPQKTTETIQSESTKTTGGPYCGLLCLYMMMKTNSHDVDLKDVVKPEYISSNKGSSLTELRNAAEDYGIYATMAGKLTSRLLRKSSYQIILHVKSSMESKTYDHYVLFLGTQKGMAKIFDPPESVKLLSFAELAQYWDGTGLIVSTNPIELNSLLASSRTQFILYVVIAITIILILHWAKRFFPKSLLNSRFKFMCMSVTQVSVFAITAMLIGMVYNFTNETGFLANANAMISIQNAHQGNFIPKISEKKVEELLGTDTVFIDARLYSDYKAGHIEDAISVPIDSNDVERYKATAGISKDAKIVMYCQSSGCQYAEIVAIKLKEDGFSNISIYKGGWRDWTAKNSEKKEETSS